MMTVMMMIYALLIVDKWYNVSVDVIQVGAIKGCTNIEPINVGKPAPLHHSQAQVSVVMMIDQGYVW